MRIDDYKFRFIDQPNGWLGDKDPRRTCPISPTCAWIRSSARAGPTMGRRKGAQQYFDWFKFQFWRFVFVQQIVGKEIQTFLEYPADAAWRELQPRCRQGGDAEKDGTGRGSLAWPEQLSRKPSGAAGLVGRRG